MERFQIRIVSPGLVALNVFVLALVLMHGGSIVSALYANRDTSLNAVSSAEIDQSLRSIKRRLSAHEDRLQALLLPEGGFLCNVFYGYSLVNLALVKDTDQARQAVCTELEQVISQAESYGDQRPFNWKDISTRGGIIFSGNVNRLRAGYALLGGSDPKILNEFHSNSKLISYAFAKANPPFPESFPGLSWPVDGICALDSLRLHDMIYKTTYFQVQESWLNWLKIHLDPESGLMVAQVDPKSGKIIDRARGCAMSWSLALLPGMVDQQFCKEQYSRFKHDWFVPFGPGLLGVREWYQGKERPTDYLPGPVWGGLGAAATGLGMAASHANGDFQSWHQILAGLNTFGIPLSTVYGEKSYFCGQSLLCDVLALWGKTVIPWSAAPFSPRAEPGSEAATSSTLLMAAILVMFSLCTIMIFRLKTLLFAPDCVRPRGRTTVFVAAIQLLLIGLWLFTPLLGSIQVLLIMVVIVLLEEISLRPAILAQKMRETQIQSQTE